MPHTDTPMKPRLEDYGDMSAHEEAVCPSCGEPLIGSEHGTLRVVRTVEESYRRVVLIHNTDGTFRVTADPAGGIDKGRQSVRAECTCGQAIDAAVDWAE